jgi:hypothetical protein
MEKTTVTVPGKHYDALELLGQIKKSVLKATLDDDPVLLEFKANKIIGFVAAELLVICPELELESSIIASKSLIKKFFETVFE